VVALPAMAPLAPLALAALVSAEPLRDLTHQRGCVSQEVPVKRVLNLGCFAQVLADSASPNAMSLARATLTLSVFNHRERQAALPGVGRLG